MGVSGSDNDWVDGRILYSPPRLSQLECRTITRLCFALFLICLSGHPISAQDYPALHHVDGVAANDVLNIRSAPSATSAIIGFLEPDQKWIEVIARDSSAKWGLVNSGETAGWVSLHYMARARQGNWLDLENMLSCFGTEPFWSLQLDSSHAVFDINGKANNYVLQNYGRAANRNHKSGFGARSSSDPRLSLTGIISAQSCSDGMSDQEYGISVDLVLFKNADLSVLSGCCSVQP